MPLLVDGLFRFIRRHRARRGAFASPIGSCTMKRMVPFAIVAALTLCGCERDADTTPAQPGVDVDVNKTPDLDPRTDDDVDVDVRTPDVDVDVDRPADGVPDV